MIKVGKQLAIDKNIGKEQHYLDFFQKVFKSNATDYHTDSEFIIINQADFPIKRIRLIDWHRLHAKLFAHDLPLLKPLKNDELLLICNNSHKILPGDILLKFNGKDHVSPILETLKYILNPKFTKNILIISPAALSKTHRNKELKLVQFSNEHFEEVGFIKLPLFSLEDVFKYANKNAYSLIVIPETEKGLIRSFLKSEGYRNMGDTSLNIVLYPHLKVN